jgi:hypothetical protein
MIVEFFIPGEFTTLNQHIAAANANRNLAAKIKREETGRVRFCAVDVPPIEEYPVDLYLIWYRANRKSDPDNIAFAIKYILDGLQDAGVMKQDTWECVRSITHEFRIDKDAPGVAVTISKGYRSSHHA